MTKLTRLFKDHADAGALNDSLAVWGFVDETTFLTKAGAVGVAFRLRPVDDACIEPDAREATTRRFAQALRQLDEHFRLYVYLEKKLPDLTHPTEPEHPTSRAAFARRRDYLERRADHLYTYELTAILLYEGWRSTSSVAASAGTSIMTAPIAALRERLSSRRTLTILSAELTQAVSHLQAKAQTFAAQLSDTLHPTPLDKAQIFRFLREMLNPAPHKSNVPLKYDTHLDFFVADSPVECGRDALDIDGYRVKVVTMKEPPSRTFPHVLADLLAIPTRFVACLEWQRLSNERIRRDIHARRRHFFNKKVSLINYLNTETRPDEMLSDDSAAATVSELGQALTDLDVHGHAFGACSFSIVVLDKDPQRVDRGVAACIKAFATHDGSVFEETYNLLNAWLATIPGNGAHNLRRLALAHVNAADLAPLFAPHSGQRENPPT